MRKYKVCNFQNEILFCGTVEEIAQKYGVGKGTISNCTRGGKFKKQYCLKPESYSYMSEVISVKEHLRRYGNTVVQREPERMLSELKKLGVDATYREEWINLESDIKGPLNKKKSHIIYIFEV